MIPLAAAFASCDGTNYYNAKIGDCVTAPECTELGLIPYKLLRECSRVYVPDAESGFGPDEGGAYTCPSGKYAIVDGDAMRCVTPSSSCGYYVAHGVRMCPPRKCSALVWSETLGWDDEIECLSSQCYARGGFYYLYYCLTAQQCH